MDLLRFSLELGVASWLTLGDMAPYLLAGFVLSGVLALLADESVVRRHLSGNGPWPVIKAAIFGMPLPLCSCGVIPVAASLRRQGASPGATSAFLLSTPQTGVDSILATLGVLGPVFAVVRPVSALVTGVVGGYLTQWLCGRAGGCEDARESSPDVTGAGKDRSLGVKLAAALKHGFLVLPRDIGAPVLAGAVVAVLISILVPPDLIGRVATGGLAQMFIMMAVGIPIYVCATGSIPIAAALMAKGLSPGAALVFLMTGPATNAATIGAVWKMIGTRGAFAYLLAVAMCALASGVGLNWLMASGWSAGAGHMAHSMMSGWVRRASTAALLLIWIAAIFHGRIRRRSEAGGCCEVGGSEDA